MLSKLFLNFYFILRSFSPLWGALSEGNSGCLVLPVHVTHTASVFFRLYCGSLAVIYYWVGQNSFQFWLLFSNWLVLFLSEYLCTILLFHFPDPPDTPFLLSCLLPHRHWHHVQLVDAVNFLLPAVFRDMWVFFVDWFCCKSCFVLLSSWLLFLCADSLQKYFIILYKHEVIALVK